MRSIVLSCIFVLAISFQVVKVHAQSEETDGSKIDEVITSLESVGNGENSVVSNNDIRIEPTADNTLASNSVSDSVSNSVSDIVTDDDLPSSLTLPPLQPLLRSNGETSIPIKPYGSENSSNDSATNNESSNIGISKSLKDLNEKFSPQDNNSPVPHGTLPPPVPYSAYNNEYGNSNSNGYGNGYTNQTASPDQSANKPIPYLMWHRDPWTHRLNLAPYAPGYAASPQDFPIPPSDFSLWLTNFPSHGNRWPQQRYLGYYDPMPEIVSAVPSRRQLILGYPSVPPTQYRDPYTGQPLPYNPAINPESILPVRESLLERWRRRALERRSAPLGQFPGQPQPPNMMMQPVQSPLFGGQQYYGQENQYNNGMYQNQEEQEQPNQVQPYQPQTYQPMPVQPRYYRRPLGRFRQGLRDRIQRLGIFEALTQRQSRYVNPNVPNPNNAVYGEAPAYDGTN
ncbi:MAG: hypothetical protein LBE18_03075 [Planctomycetaceae bacterium]|jgi:hypothetical protein|nr:hypothetical protein [Planctomycetaceae bacterium]